MTFIVLIGAILLFRWRRQKKSDAALGLSRGPHPFGAEDKVDEPSGRLTDVPSLISPALRSPGLGSGSHAASNDVHPTSPVLADMKREQTAAVYSGENHRATDAGAQPAPGSSSVAQVPTSTPPAAATTSDPAVLHELQSLREEVRRLVAERNSEAPPSYDHHGD